MHGMCNDIVQLAILKKSTKSKLKVGSTLKKWWQKI